MITVQSVKQVSLEPTSVTNGQTAALLVDTKAFDYATFFVQISRSNNATNVPTVFQVSQADVTNVSSFVAISGSSQTTAYTTASTTAADNFTIGVATNARQRYLRLTVSPVTTQTVSATCVLSRPENSPLSNSDYGVAVAPTFI